MMLIETSVRPRILVVRNARVPKHFCDNEKTFLRVRAKVKQQQKMYDASGSGVSTTLCLLQCVLLVTTLIIS